MEVEGPGSLNCPELVYSYATGSQQILRRYFAAHIVSNDYKKAHF